LADDNSPPTLKSKRSLTLRFNIPISKTSRFWEALGEGKLVTTKCEVCGKLTFPPQASSSGLRAGRKLTAGPTTSSSWPDPVTVARTRPGSSG
jgi:rubredoxin-like zinc ribbon protein